MAKKSSNKKVDYPKVQLTVLIKQKICKIYGPPPEHSYDEEHVFIRWVIGCSQKDFLRESWVFNCLLKYF